MTDKINKSEKIEVPRRALQPSLPKRPSYEKVVEDIEKWAHSSGLQKPS